MASSVESATIDAHRGRHAAAAWLLSGLLLTTSTVHFVSPKGFESIVPKFLGSPATWVYASGVAELGCAAAVAFKPTRRRGALACAALFVAVFPANIQMALDSSSGSHDLLRTPLVAWARLPLQIPLIAWALYVAHTATSVTTRSEAPRATTPDA